MRKTKRLSDQVKEERKRRKKEGEQEREFSYDQAISTGSTLLDLAICGSKRRGGGLIGGILVEIFGPSGAGKSALLCEIAGAIQRQGGAVDFYDPEARMVPDFAAMLGVDTKERFTYSQPDTVKKIFIPVRKKEIKDKSVINGVCADSLAALTTEEEMTDKDNFGGMRAKQFSAELRKTCRVIAKRNVLMVCSNQVRDNIGGGPFGPKDRTTGGRAIEFYATVRIQMFNPRKIKKTIKIGKGEVKKVVGITSTVTIAKNSLAAPHNTVQVSIIFDYGVDDIRENLNYVKEITGAKEFAVKGISLSKNIDRAIALVEKKGYVKKLRNQVIHLWNEVDSKFASRRSSKRRF